MNWSRVIRVLQWAAIAAFFFIVSATMPLWWPFDWVKFDLAQTVTFKLGLATCALYLGFWAYESLSRDIPATSYDQLAQCLLVGSVVIAVCLGL
jgi:hypothetical protein